MTTNFETARAELRRLGLTLAQRPGEYVVNFISGTESTAHIAPDLDDALAHGRQMATAAAAATPAAAPGKKYRRPRRMTPKAQRRRMIRQHNRRMRARAIHQKKPSTDEKK